MLGDESTLLSRSPPKPDSFSSGCPELSQVLSCSNRAKREACGDKSVPHGTNCTARCRLPYNGTVTAAFCPEEGKRPGLGVGRSDRLEAVFAPGKMSKNTGLSILAHFLLRAPLTAL